MSLLGPGRHSISPGALGSVPETALITLDNGGERGTAC
jgi:hypothetical protein